MAGRVSQEPIEAIVAPTSESGRISQDVVEAIVAPTSESGRISQVVTEGLLFPTSESGRISQVVTEGLLFPTSESGRISQVVVEVVIVAMPDIFPVPPAALPPQPYVAVGTGALEGLIYSGDTALHQHIVRLGEKWRQVHVERR